MARPNFRKIEFAGDVGFGSKLWLVTAKKPGGILVLAENLPSNTVDLATLTIFDSRGLNDIC